MSLRGQVYGTTILTRAEIGLRPPRSTTGIPAVEMDTAHYAGPTDWRQSGIDRSTPERFRDTTDHNRCRLIMLAHQAYHMDTKGWADYAYSGAACPHGVAFIGRGRGVRTAAQGTTDGNNRSYAIQYMGAGPDDPLTVEAKRAFIDLTVWLGQPLMRGHRDWKSTSCPGDKVYAWRTAGFPRPPIPQEDDMPLDANDLENITRIAYEQSRLALRQAVGPDDGKTPASGWFDKVGADVRALRAELAALRSAVGQLGGGDGTVDYARVQEAAEAAVREVFADAGDPA